MGERKNWPSLILATVCLLSSSYPQVGLSLTLRSELGICVGSDVDCLELRQTSGGIINCVSTRDRVDCLKKLENGEADFGYFDAEDQKMAALSKTVFEAPLEFTTGKEIRAVYLLVHNASNTQPKTLCHPGFNRQKFFPRALYSPTTLETNYPTGDIQSLIIALSEAWESACIPGTWSPDPITDRQLKRDHPQLCSLCVRKSCDLEDPYAGSGALQCLLDHTADAAFVSDLDFKVARAKNPAVENLFHFCRNEENPIVPLGGKTKDDGEPCDWGQRPLPVLLTPTCSDADCKVRKKFWVNSLTSHAAALKDVLDLPRSSTMDVRRNPSAYLDLTGDFNPKSYTPKAHVTFCVQTKDEEEKCQDLVRALSAFTASGSVGIKCLLAEDTFKIFSNIYFGFADVITLDGSDVYQVSQDYGFDRVLSEIYDEAAVTPTSSYYAVAVIRAESNITSFEHLRGKASCHTGIGKTAGWRMPVATLMEERLIDPAHCNYINAMADFFSAGSCAPGGKSSTYNEQQSYTEELCRLCRGEGKDHCARSSAEPFYSYEGAFRCLVHGGGDVAFVKHSTVPSLTGGSTSASWAVGLQEDQFKLLCPAGGTAAVTEYKTCNLALVPAHEVVVSGRMSSDRKQEVRETLLGVSQIFNPDAFGSKTFRLFGSYHGHPDLLFKDSAVNLRALSEDTQEERDRKNNYFKKLDELHNCEVRVCALEDQMEDCKAMSQMMLHEGHQFVCVSARDRMDCIYRVIRGQVDMTPLPERYLGINPDLRVFAEMRDPVYAQQEFRYKAVMVVRRSTVKRISDLRGKKSCHTGYGKTAGWRVPLALLKRAGVVHPICGDSQSSVEHEIVALATTFNRACIPGTWAVLNDTDAALKERYTAMCSMCKSGTCDEKDEYAGYEGALKCLTEKGGDVAFTKLSTVKEFFKVTRTVNSSLYGLLCPDNKVVDINSPKAERCFWATRPWDAYVTHGGVSDAKVHRLFWALTEAKRKAEEDMEARQWYFTTLGIGDASDVFPMLETTVTRQYYAKTRMDVVEAEEMCSETPVRFCVRNDEEENKCNDLRSVLNLRGTMPPLQCVRAQNTEDCLFRINVDQADLISLDDVTRYRFNDKYNLVDLVSENYGAAQTTNYYLLAVVKKSPDLTSTADLAGKTTCHSLDGNSTIDYSLTGCISGKSDFFDAFSDAMGCLSASNKDVAFVKLPHESTVAGEYVPPQLNLDDFQLLCANGVMPLNSSNAPQCNLGRVPANMVVTRFSESSSRRQDMLHLLLESAKVFGKPDSFFRLFSEYYSAKDLLFRDKTTSLTSLPDKHYQVFLASMWNLACQLYDVHVSFQSVEKTKL